MSLEDSINTKQKTGKEPFFQNGQDSGFALVDFWRWNTSDLVSNVTRGRLAEFIIAKALTIDTSIVRDEWAAYDLETHDGVKIEVKSAAYVQSWYQKKLSTISFSIKETLSWNRETNKQSKAKTRDADIYIFALLDHKDKSSINPLNLDQWKFFVLTITEIRAYKRSKSSITLSSLQKLTRGVNYADLGAEFAKKCG